MEDSVVRVLPALVQKPVARLSIVFKESVPVSIAVTIHPKQRGLDVRPDPLNEPSVTSSLEVRARQHNEKRRRIHGAVRAAEGNRSKGRHLPRCSARAPQRTECHQFAQSTRPPTQRKAASHPRCRNSGRRASLQGSPSHHFASRAESYLAPRPGRG